MFIALVLLIPVYIMNSFALSDPSELNSIVRQTLETITLSCKHG